MNFVATKRIKQCTLETATLQLDNRSGSTSVLSAQFVLLALARSLVTTRIRMQTNLLWHSQSSFLLELALMLTIARSKRSNFFDLLIYSQSG